MPVTTVRYSAALEQTYEEEEEDATGQQGRTAIEEGRATSTMSTSSSSSSCGDPLNNSSIGAADEGPADDQSSVCGSCSGSSTTSGGGEHSRQASVDGTEFIPTRTLKASTAGRPAFNPLQFVKTGNVFYKKSEQQSRGQYEDVRKVKEMVKEEEEAWQSNLDNWKSKRRQISHQTIQRAEEIKQIEEIEHDRQRKKSKTFTEILQDRSKRKASSVKLPLYRDDEDDDDSCSHVWKDNNNDSGWSSDRGNEKNVAALPPAPKLDASFDSSGSDGVFHDDDLDGQHHDSRQTGHDKIPDKGLLDEATDEATNEARTTGIGNGSSNKDKDKEVVAKEEEVYTFEKAIRSYMEFAESRKTTSTPSSTLREKDKAVEQTASSDSGAKGHCSRQYDDDSSVEEKSPMKSPPSALHDAQNEQRQHRAEGDELSIIVCLKRGSGESKDFGFTTKTVVTGDGGTNNVFVESLVPGGAAAVSGLRVGDEVLAINCECTSNRTHSAIVFAVKQAVYTGRLELNIYRYAHLPLAFSTPDKPSSSSLDDSGSEVVRRRRRHDQTTTTKTKVVTERRSMFEASSQARHGRVDTSLHRRSLDFSGSNGNMSSLRDKLASFENLDLDSRSSSPGSGMGLRRTPERDATFERKLASFKSMDSLNDRSAKDRLQLINNNARGRRGGEAFRQKLSSFENLNNVDARRSRSCDFLNDVGCGSDNETGEEAVAEVGSQLAKTVDDRPSSWRRLTMSDVEDGLEHLITAEECLKKDVVDEQCLLTPKGLPTPSEQVEDESYDPQMNKTGFALAMDLPETAITWSECNSPTPSCHDDQSVSTSTLEGTHQTGATLNLEASTVTDTWQEEEGQQEGPQEEVDFDLPRPSTLLEPPKEKPPPPPIDGSRTTSTNSSGAIKRISSTKRIRKEICRRRSDFLGFEADVIDIGANCVTATPPKPEIQSQVDDLNDELRSSSSSSSSVDIMSNNKSEEEEMARKEREIIENLEREEQQLNQPPMIGANVATMDSVEDEISRLEEERKLREREEILRRQEEVLQREKEKLRLEQERLLREKEAYKKQIHEHHRIGNATGEIDEDGHLLDRREYVVAIEKASRAAADHLPSPQQAPPPPPPPPPPPSKPKMKTDLSPLHIESRVATRQKPSSPPIGHLVLHVDETAGAPQIRENSFSPNAVTASTSSRSPSSKHMIHAMSASPRARLKDSDQWMAEHGRNSASNVHDCNNGYSRQHWLVQEAEMRRLIQQQDREANNNNNNNNNKLRNVNNNIERVPPAAAAAQHRQSLGHCSRPTTSNVVVDRLNAPPRNAPQKVQQPNMHHHLSGLSTSRGPFQYANPPPARHSSPGPAKPAAGRPVHASADQQSTSMLMAPQPPPPPPAQPLRSSPSQPTTKHNGGHGPVTLNDTVLSVSGKKKCSHCSQELGRGAAMIVESLGLYYHIECFKCCVCLVKLGNGSSGTDVRVRNHKLHCHNCYSNDEGLKFSKV